MGLLAILVTIALVAVGGTAAVGGYLYATDYALKADVTGTDCTLENIVSVRTRTFGIDHDVRGVPEDQCNLLHPGDYVEYHVRTKHTILYRDGAVCYDSDTGPGPACLPGGLALL